MEIREISTGFVSDYKPKTLSSKELQEIKEKKLTSAKDTQKSTSDWQKSILLDALDRLENSIQMDNSHPLDYKNNAPIETFDEALIELSFTKSDIFKEQAYGAQANINASDVVSLFTEEYV